MVKNKMQVVFASAEVAPFVKTGGLGDVAGSLPQELVKDGCDVIVMCPKYASIPDEFKARMEHYTDFYVPLGWRNEYCGLEKIEEGGVTYLFVDNEHYFNRSYPYGFFDDGERFAFFSKAICESLQHLPAGFECDILHCNDWQTALAPVFLREFYQGLPLYERVKTIFTIHNIAFQGQFSDKMLNDVLGLAHIPNAARQLRCDSSSINFMQGALCYSDAITTVSPSYACEIKTSDYGEGLDWILRQRSDILSGILNGIDEPSWDPSTDFQIAENYGVGNMGGKAACKRALQQELGLEVRDDRPLMVMVSRLTRQKGMDLVTYSLDRILSGGVQVAVLGTGERAYEDAMNYFAASTRGPWPRASPSIPRSRAACTPAPTSSSCRPSSSRAASRRSSPCATARCPWCARRAVCATPSSPTTTIPARARVSRSPTSTATRWETPSSVARACSGTTARRSTAWSNRP